MQTLRSRLLSLRHLLTIHPENEMHAEHAEEACAALLAVDQESALCVAAQPISGRDEKQHAIADRRIGSGEQAGDETLTASMLVPLLRRACLIDDQALMSRTLDAVGTLTASLSGHGEHTLRVALGPLRQPLLLQTRPMGLTTGLRLWPVARLAIGALVAEWAGLAVKGCSVLEIGCGTGAVGLACAALGASSVWLTDIDDGSLALAAANAELNGMGAMVHVAKLDMLEARDLAAAKSARLLPCFDVVLAVDVLYGWESRADEALLAVGRYLDSQSTAARALCCFGQTKRSDAARRVVAEFERITAGRGCCASGLRCIAREEVPGEGPADGFLMLLLARGP